jgi:uncharacterized protein YjbJ (UPF0337 family)
LKGKLKDITGKLGMNSEPEAEGKDEKIAGRGKEQSGRRIKCCGQFLWYW